MWTSDRENQIWQPLKERYREPIKHEHVYVDGTLENLAKLIAEVDTYKANINHQIETLPSDIRQHLWVDGGFVSLADTGLRQTRDKADNLRSRLMVVREAYKNIPRKEPDDNVSSAKLVVWRRRKGHIIREETNE